MQHTVWFLVADQSRATIYAPQESGRLEAVHAFERPEVRAHTSELMTGSRGRRTDQGTRTGQRSAMDRQTPVQDVEVEKLVLEVTEWLGQAAHKGAFGELVIVAAPKMLGMLRERFTPPTLHKLRDTLDKNYASLSVQDLTDHLRRRFPDDVPTRRRPPMSAQRGNQQPTA